MLKRIILILSLVSNIQICWCQKWAALDSAGTNWYVGCLYSDSSTNKLYVGGPFSIIGNQTIRGVGVWDGHTWDSLGVGIDSSSLKGAVGGNVWAIIRYKGDLYVGGSFETAGGISSPYISRWDGSHWHTLNGGQPNGSVGCMMVYNNELYVGGDFDSLGSVSAKGIGKWNGNSWTSLNLQNYGSRFDYNDVYSMKNYQGNLYICGELITSPGDYKRMAWYDGITWHYFQDDIKGQIANVACLEVYNGELYVAGLFSKSDSNYENNIQRWNGKNWNSVGGGTDVGGYVLNLKAWKGKLYATGVFSKAGGVPANEIAYWNGVEWCGFGSTFDNAIDAIDFYNDTLYVGGGFKVIDGQRINCIAKWIGGNYVDTCGSIIEGISNLLPKSDISIYPNPTSNLLQLSNLPTQTSTLQYSIINILGQVKQSNTLPPNNTSASINVSTLPVGVYFIRLTDSKGLVYSSKFVKQ